MIAIESTVSAGQRVLVEELDRQRWQVECLGEPVAVGARIRFEPVGALERRQGVLVRLLEDPSERWVCTLRRRGSQLELIPFGGAEAPPLALGPREAKRAREGDRVVVVPQGERARASGRGHAATQRPARSRARGGDDRPGARRREGLPVRIVEVLGPAGHPEADHRALAARYRLPRAFSRRARLEAEALSQGIATKELARRVDLRHLPFITIDPASARDHDDALFAEARVRPRLARLGTPGSEGSGDARPARGAGPDVDRSGWGERLWVAIADVGHFVSEGGFIDAEARRRGNSFYFPDRALPMLPERLSSDLCSLRPEQDRLALVVELRLSDAGEVVDALFHEAVIRSRARLSYEEAARWLDEAGRAPSAADGVAPEYLDSLQRLARIADRLGGHRRRAGALELALPEVEIAVDDEGRPLDARLRERNPAHGLVEEAMLAANRAVAAVLERARLDAVHRVHPPPEPRRLEALARLLARQGVEPPVELDEPGAIARVLEALRGAPAEERLHLAALRAMSQARYEAEGRGHFALQFRHYLHFTSPIRRYADLVAHRALKAWLRAAAEGAASPRSAAEAPSARLERLAIWLSGRERVAVEAEREAAAFACCALLAGREGETFEAVVTGVTEHGLFVRLERPAASGLVPARSLAEDDRLDEEAESLVLAGGGSRIEVGGRVRVRLVGVDDDRGRLAFALMRSRGQRSDRRRSQASPTDSDSVSQSR